MSRKLFKQIRSEWRSNIWLTVELIIVSVVLFVLLDRVTVVARMTNEYVGFEIDNTYEMWFGQRSEESPEYVAGGDNMEDFMATIERLKAHPDIEAVSFGSSTVYNYNFSGNSASVLLDTLTPHTGRLNTFMVMPDYVKVFKPRGYHGETPEQLAEVLERGDYIVTSNMVLGLDGCSSVDQLYNKEIYFGIDSVARHIGAVIAPVKRSDTEPAWHATLLRPLTSPWDWRLYVRARPGRGQAMLESLRSDATSYFAGNFYLSNIQSLDTIRTDLHHSDYITMRNMYICMGFLLVTVFLGLLGTFWFRTQQRVREIGIRMVAGATGASIFRRLLGEGLIILLVATPPAMAVDALLVSNDIVLNQQVYPDGAWLFAFGLTMAIAALEALMIVAGICFPARKAMVVDPAMVMRNE